MSKRASVVQDLRIIIPPEESANGANELIIGDRKFIAETARAFKVAEVLRIVSRVTQYDAAADILNTLAALTLDKSRDLSSPLVLMGLAYQVLPRLFELAPELVFDLAAILSISNAELKEASKQPNGIKERVSERKEWLMWEVDAADVMHLIAHYLPTLGLEHLKNVALPMVTKAIPAVTEWLGKGGSPPSAPSADSSSSPATSGQ